METNLDLDDVTADHPIARQELIAMQNELELMNLRIITCGIAARRPDISRRETDYGGPWNTQQAEDVRALRDERDQLIVLAKEAVKAWDTDQDARVGKLLMAMIDSDFRKQYRPDLYA